MFVEREIDEVGIRHPVAQILPEVRMERCLRSVPSVNTLSNKMSIVVPYRTSRSGKCCEALLPISQTAFTVNHCINLTSDAVHLRSTLSTTPRKLASSNFSH